MSQSGDIKLNFINESGDQNNSEVMFFQKDVVTEYNSIAIAWKVIKNCATGWHHPFTFPMQMQIGASDPWGNEIIDLLDATNGQLFVTYESNSGVELKYDSPSPSRSEVQLRNDLAQGSIDAEIFKDGKLLACKTGVSPNQKAVFQLEPVLWVGVVSNIEEGDAINSAVLSSINAKLSLRGIVAADVVMTGGGVGVNAVPFNFELENIVYA